MKTALRHNLAAVIMAGGSGTRFWPISSDERPKQFLPLLGQRSLLQATYDRLASFLPPRQILVLTNQRYLPLARRQLPKLPKSQIIGEPLSRDTAAAVALGAALCQRLFGDCLMAVLPADHHIAPPAAFRRAILKTAAAARRHNALFTLGIPPTYPATGYGYLEEGEALDDDGLMRVQRFHEKPNLETAQGYLERGGFFWNSGIFLWPVQKIMEEVALHLPQHARAIYPLAQRFGRPGFAAALRRAFRDLPRLSIDFGVMEKSSAVAMARALFAWDDLGGWLSLGQYLKTDAQENAAAGRLAALEARDNLVFCENPRETVALLGVSGLVVVRAGDRTLVVPKARAQEIKQLVEKVIRPGGY